MFIPFLAYLDNQALWLITTCFLLVAFGLIVAIWVFQRRQRHQSEQLDDALKLIATLKLECHLPTISRLGGLMGLIPQRMLQVVDRLLQRQWVQLQNDQLLLTNDGRQRAVHLLRAHRLIETQLVYDAGLPLDQVHRQADRQEHHITKEQLTELNEHLGFPAFDPHGDPIPAASTNLEPGKTWSLASWAIHKPAIVTHVEDEPPAALRKLLDMNVTPGSTLLIKQRDEQQLLLEVEGQPHTMPNTLALSVQVQLAVVKPAESGLQVVHPLTALQVGQTGRIVTLSRSCQGFGRRRLLDLGLTPGTSITAKYTNFGHSATAYTIRHTLIALRQEQAKQILIQVISNVALDQLEVNSSHAT